MLESSSSRTVDNWLRLVVYDVLGREVALLAKGRFRAGKISFRFDGSNLASGIYFCCLLAGNVTLVRKMTLIR